MSSVQNIAKNSTIRVYYKSSSLETGLDVRFDFYKLSGQPISINQPADYEVPGKGVYYYDFTSPNENTYVVGKAYVAGYTDVEPIVFKVGEPSQKVLFYYTEKTILRPLTYRVYNTLGDNVQEGELTGIGSTSFYYTVFTPPPTPFLQTDNNFFFEVDDTYASEPFVAGVASITVPVFDITSTLQAVTVAGEGVYDDSTNTTTIQIIQPTVTADALVVVNVFSGLVSPVPPEETGDATVTTSIDSVTSSLIQPVVSGDAVVMVSVFDGITVVPQPEIPNYFASIQSVSSSLNTPVVSGDAVVNVSTLTLNTVIHSVVAGQVTEVGVLGLSITVNQPKVVAQQNAPQTPTDGYPYDDRWSLGAAPGIPLGIGSQKWPFITIQFRICGDNFTCQEGIYHKKSGLYTDTRIKIENIRHKPKKTGVKMTKVMKESHDGPEIKVLELKKV